jgi:hypothetical protein
LKQGTTLEEARRLVSVAVKELPQLTSFGIGVHYSYDWLGKEAVALETRKQQAELGTETSLKSVACCIDWINGHHTEIGSHRTSYLYARRTEQWRRDNGDPDPYTCVGSFIAAGVGLKLSYKIEVPNCVFSFPTLRERISTALWIEGRELRGNKIFQVFLEECPWILLGSPYVVEDNIDLEALALEMGVL